MRRGCFSFLGVLAALALVAAAAWMLGKDYLNRQFDPDPTTIAAASLQGLREQNRLSTFAARYVAVVTSRQRRMGLSAQKTLIMPGMVRYEVDLARLEDDDVQWDGATNTLRVDLPPLEIVGPQVDMNAIREYGEGGILMSLTDAEDRLDAANRQAAQQELVRQAREAMPMRLARDATRRAVERSFSMPLRAVGIEARVQVRFPDERSGRGERWDVSPSARDVLQNRQ